MLNRKIKKKHELAKKGNKCIEILSVGSSNEKFYTLVGITAIKL